MTAAITLRDYQHEAVEAVRRSFRSGHHAPLLVMPTGAGKTVVFTYIASAGAARGFRILLLAHRRELISQISRSLTTWQVPHGVISPGHPVTDHPIQVGSTQTVARRLGKITHRWDLVVIDEAHHVSRGSQWGQIIDHGVARILGVTATPVRLDGKGLGIHDHGYFDDMVLGPTVQELIDQGHLCAPVVYAPPESSLARLAGVKITGGDYDARALAQTMDKPTITGDAVDHYRKLADGLPAIAFSITVEHAEHVARQFREAGYQAASLSGSTPARQREQMITDLGDGKLHVLASCNVISEGTDVPRVAAAILLRPTASYGLFVQQVGRALRSYPGKERAIILDHAGNTFQHGYPTDPVEWSLDGKPKRGPAIDDERRPSVRRCPHCDAILPASTRRCQGCKKLLDEEPGPDVIPEELVEVQPTAVARVAGVIPWREKRELIQAASSLRDFQQVARQLGYKSGWAWHQYNDRIGNRTVGGSSRDP